MAEKVLSVRQMAEAVAAIDARTKEMDNYLKVFIRMTARAPDGRTLMNVVLDILDHVADD